MNFYAVAATGGNVIRVDAADAPPAVDPGFTATLLPAFNGWPQPPSTNATLACTGGALTWADARTLAELLADKLAELAAAYAAAIAQPVTYAGNPYQAGPEVINGLKDTMLRFAAAGATPPGFSWGCLGVGGVPTTYADLQGIAHTIGSRDFAAMGNLQTKRAAVRAATTPADVAAVTW
ncbi:MAG: hypothetical protein KGM91_23205 [Burkholderiales bacterium]|nr:hypothetical protein [Burkholderiales bacterium]